MSMNLNDNVTFLRGLIRELVALNAREYKATIVVDGAKWRVQIKADRTPRAPRKKATGKKAKAR
jgi:hypothetical protein